MVRLKDVTPEQLALISDGCGETAKGLRVPDFIFTADCRIHDFLWARGTGWSWNSHWFLPYSVIRWYLQGQYWLQRANVLFFYYMLKDAWSPRYEILEHIIYTFLATVYYIAVTLYALIPNTITMHEWRTIEEMVIMIKKSKKGNRCS